MNEESKNPSQATQTVTDHTNLLMPANKLFVVGCAELGALSWHGV